MQLNLKPGDRFQFSLKNTSTTTAGICLYVYSYKSNNLGFIKTLCNIVFIGEKTLCDVELDYKLQINKI